MACKILEITITTNENDGAEFCGDDGCLQVTNMGMQSNSYDLLFV